MNYVRIVFYNHFAIYSALTSLGAPTYQSFNGRCHNLTALGALIPVALRAVEDIHKRSLETAANSF